MSVGLERLLSPIRLGPLRIPNRVAMSACHLCFTDDGLVNDKVVDFYTARARGEAGLILIGGCAPERRGRVWIREIAVDHDEAIPGLARLADSVHEAGSGIGAQLLHGGSSTHPFITKNRPLSASDVPSNFAKVKPKTMEEPEMEEVIAAYASATKRLRSAGFDAVEIHGGMGYLLNQFLSPRTNRRRDRYGGAIENRALFPRRVLEAVRAAAGSELCVILKISGEDLMEGGLSLEETLQLIGTMEEAGADAFHVSPGWHITNAPYMLQYVPQAAYTFASSQVKGVSSIPVITSVRIDSLRLGEEILRSGEADVIAMTRPFIADPEIVLKAREGREEDTRRCLACNQGCFDQMLAMKPVSCLVNPRVGREAETELRPAEDPRRVVVCGGGPAGLEAARVAAERGHSVVVLEQRDVLGGQIWSAAAPPGKQGFMSVLRFYETRIEKLGIDVRLSTPASRETVAALEPDVVVLATGAVPRIPPIPGVEGPDVHVARDLLMAGAPDPGRNVVIAGGSATACEAALYLADMGTMRPEVAAFFLRNRTMEAERLVRLMNAGTRKVLLIEATDTIARGFGRSTTWVVKRHLAERGVEALTSTRVVEVLRDGGSPSGGVTGVRFRSEDGVEGTVEADSVVLALGYDTGEALHRELAGLECPVHRIGDCLAPRTMLEAIHEGFQTGLEL